MTGCPGNTGSNNLTYGEFIDGCNFYDDGLSELAQSMLSIMGENINACHAAGGQVKDMSINPYVFVSTGMSALGLENIGCPNDKQLQEVELIKVLAYQVAKPEYADKVNYFVNLIEDGALSLRKFH